MNARRTSRPSLTRITKLEVLVSRLTQLRRSLDGQDGGELLHQLPRRRSKHGGSLHPENHHPTLRHSHSYPQQLYAEGEDIRQLNELEKRRLEKEEQERRVG